MNASSSPGPRLRSYTIVERNRFLPLEACDSGSSSIHDASPWVIYTDDEVKTLEQARSAANDGDQYVIIVADECLDRTASQMESTLQGVEDRFRVITIDNAFERMDHTDLRLQRVNISTLEKIVEANFPNIDPDRRFRYCHLADGSLRFAITLYLNDGLMQQEDNLGEALRDATHYLNRYFGGARPLRGSRSHRT